VEIVEADGRRISISGRQGTDVVALLREARCGDTDDPV
jgi:hypothetical protein